MKWMRSVDAHRLITFAAAFRTAWVFILLGTITQIAMRLPVPLLTAYIIDVVIPRKEWARLNWVAGLMVVASLCYLCVGIAVSYLSLRVTQSLTIRMKLRLYRHIQEAPLSKINRMETGYILARITQDPDYLEGILEQTVGLVTSALTFMAGVIAIFALNVRLALLSTLVLPFFAMSYFISYGTLLCLDNNEKEANAVSVNVLTEGLRALSTVKLLCLHGVMARRQLRAMRCVQAFQLKAFRLRAVVLIATGLFGSLGPLIVVWYGGAQIMQGQMTIGQLVAFSSLLAFMYGPIKSMIDSHLRFSRALVSINRICGILDIPRESCDLPIRAMPLRCDYALEFRKVCFHYNDEDDEVIRDVSFVVRRGETVGVVGPTGSGKTTLLRLLVRLYSPSQGSVFVNGMNAREYDLRALRRQFAILSQEPFLLSTSILENIRNGNRQASHSDVVRAASIANALSFIESLECGFETQVGEGGVSLSGGQKQLICLARVILQDAPIMLLDEPTSALDAETERMMLGCLRTYLRDRTTVIISHRLSSLLDVRRLIVLEEGHITATGSHLELSTRNGFYQRIAAISSDSMTVRLEEGWQPM